MFNLPPELCHQGKKPQTTTKATQNLNKKIMSPVFINEFFKVWRIWIQGVVELCYKLY